MQHWTKTLDTKQQNASRGHGLVFFFSRVLFSPENLQSSSQIFQKPKKLGMGNSSDKQYYACFKQNIGNGISQVWVCSSESQSHADACNQLRRISNGNELKMMSRSKLVEKIGLFGWRTNFPSETVFVQHIDSSIAV